MVLMNNVQLDDAKVRLGEDNGDETVLDGLTEKGNNCLHVASICGHMDFCRVAVECRPALLTGINRYLETPLLTAVKSMSNHDSSLATFLLNEYRSRNGLDDLIWHQDQDGCNVLHHAIRSGLKELALDLIRNSPVARLQAVNGRNESPIFMSVLRKGFEDVCWELLDRLPGNEGGLEAYGGVNQSNALHAAVKYDNAEFANRLVGSKEPALVRALARRHDNKHETPMHLAAHFDRNEVLEIMLDFDQSLGYQVSNSQDAYPLLFIAAQRGHVDFARKLLEYCPDAPYANIRGRTCLHEAVDNNRDKFVEFILEKESKLLKLINMPDENGHTALHLAVANCNPKIVSALVGHPRTDINVINNDNCAAIWRLNESKDDVKTIAWNKISDGILEADRRAYSDIYNLHEEIKNHVISASRKDVKSLSETYTSNTSLVAMLIATVTFAAAFTLPGGYISSGAESEGRAIMARNLAFQAFLIFDTLAMCSSLAVAFLCIKIRPMDYDFLIYYRTYTSKLMWFAYMATTLAFATGLYTVLSTRVHWLAIIICVLSVLLPIIMVFTGEWPISQPRPRKAFDSKFLDMV